MAKLDAAFERRTPLSKATLKIYHEELRHLPDDIWEYAIGQCVKAERFFPAISTILEHAASRPAPIEYYIPEAYRK
jgi:hypothetical protein